MVMRASCVPARHNVPREMKRETHLGLQLGLKPIRAELQHIRGLPRLKFLGQITQQRLELRGRHALNVGFGCTRSLGRVGSVEGVV